MQITDLLAQAGGLRAIAQQLGIDEQQAYKGADALMPALLSGFKQEAQAKPAGLGGIAGLFQQFGGEQLLNEVLKPQGTSAAPGNDILGQLFGSKDVSRTVAQDAAAKSGVDQGILQKMLPMLAMLVTGFLSKQASGGGAAPNGLGALGGLVGGLLGGQGGNSGANALLALLNEGNSGGNMLSNALKLAGQFKR